MLIHPTHEALRALKLDGMAEVFAQMLAQDGIALNSTGHQCVKILGRSTRLKQARM
jgi:hypothetical protein